MDWLFTHRKFLCWVHHVNFNHKFNHLINLNKILIQHPVCVANFISIHTFLLKIGIWKWWKSKCALPLTHPDTAESFCCLISLDKMLIHCVMGRSRSATLFLAYLMIHENMTVVDAIDHVKRRRRIIPNWGFLKQLRELDISLLEQRRAQNTQQTQDI